MNPKAAVVAFLQTERFVVPRATVIRALLSFGNYSGGAWPRHSAEVWGDAIDELVADGTITSQLEGLRLTNASSKPRQGLTAKPSRKSKPVDTQQDMLF